LESSEPRLSGGYFKPLQHRNIEGRLLNLTSHSRLSAARQATVLDIAYPSYAFADPETSIVNIFARAVIAAVAALGSMVANADSSGSTQRYYEVRGAKLYTQIYGHGPPIVFLHGGMMFFDNSFANQRDYFSAFRTVVGIDQRGHGHSPDGPWSLSYKMMADDTAAIIEKIGLGPVDIVGHSDGADLALVLVRDHPNLVRRLVISGANIRVDLSPEQKLRSHWSQQQLDAHLREMAAALPPWFSADYAKVSPDGPDHWLALMAKCYDMWLQPVVIEPADLKRISIPVLVMAGDHDFTSIEDNAEMFRDLPRGQLIIVPASKHGTFNSRPDLVNLAIREFLEQPDGKTPAH
jgi:pimeloyl-ACP methyl ester carboxylesterase